MSAELLPSIYVALKSHPDGLTATGLARRLPYSRPAVQRVLLELEAQGHLTATQEPLQPGDWGRACRYRLRHP